MAKDLTVILQDRPGTFADLGEALGNAAINIEGICGFPAGGEGIVHLLVEDAAGARAALGGAGLEVRAERDVLVLDIENRPGELGRVCRRMADAGVNLDLVYIATGPRLVLGADDLDKARAAL